MNNRIIHQIWLNPPMDADCIAWRSGLKSENPTIMVQLWTLNNMHYLGFSLDSLPFDNPIWNSDIIRLAAIKKYGGIYLDCDVECLGPIDRLFEYEAFSVQQRDGHINNAIFGAVPNHPWIQWQLDHVEEYIPKAREWAVYLMSDAPRDGVTLIPPEWVYPFWFDSPPEERKPKPESFLVHHWKKGWMTL